MENFQGRLVSHDSGYAETVTLQVDGDWVRIFTAHKRYGAWPLPQMEVERLTVFRFSLKVDGDSCTFTPDDPNGFGEAVGAVVDLRLQSRFGLGARVKAAREEIAVLRTQLES